MGRTQVKKQRFAFYASGYLSRPDVIVFEKWVRWATGLGFMLGGEGDEVT